MTRSIVCTVQCAVFTVQCAVCTVQCSLYTVQCAVCTVQCAVCTVQCAMAVSCSSCRKMPGRLRTIEEATTTAADYLVALCDPTYFERLPTTSPGQENFVTKKCILYMMFHATLELVTLFLWCMNLH